MKNYYNKYQKTHKNNNNLKYNQDTNKVQVINLRK
jgi:hypothetical protein